jgi:hypothetical protein
MVNNFLDKYIILPKYIKLRPVNYLKLKSSIKIIHDRPTNRTQTAYQKQHVIKNMNSMLDEEYHTIWKHHKTETSCVNYPKLVSIYGIITDIRH